MEYPARSALSTRHAAGRLQPVFPPANDIAINEIVRLLHFLLVFMFINHVNTRNYLDVSRKSFPVKEEGRSTCSFVGNYR